MRKYNWIEYINDERKQPPFGMMPAWWVDLFQWKRLSRNEMAILGVLVTRQWGKTGISQLSLEELEKESRVHIKSISDVTERLSSMSIIKKYRRRGKMKYEVLFLPPIELVESGVNFDYKKRP